MRTAQNPLSLDYAKVEKEILTFIRKMVADGGAEGVVVGLSGGIDSAVVGALCVRALGNEKVIGILMPASHTPAQDTKDAREMAKKWGIRTYEVGIDPVFDAFMASLPEFKVESKIPKANVKARIRMIINYYIANSNGMLVAGTGDKSEDMIGFFCYDEKTRIVTTRGPMGLDELKAGDRVFSIDPRTNMMVETSVENVHIFDYDGEMIQFGGRGADLLVTPNHRMLVHNSSSNLKSKLVFRQAKDCLKSRDVLTPVPLAWDGNQDARKHHEITFSQRHIKRTATFPIEEMMYLFGLFIGDGCAIKGRVIVPVKSEISRVEYLSRPRSAQGRFVSLQEGDQSVRLKEYDTYETTFALPDYTKDVARKRLLSILRKHGVGYSLTRDTVRIPSKGIYEAFAQCGFGARHKRIPRWILDQPSSVLIHLFQGLKDSDGAHAADVNQYFTSSERLKDDFVELCFKLGRRATISFNPEKRPVINGKTIRTGASYSICYSGKARLQHALKSRLARTVKYRGKIWCPSVPPFENILVERNGKYAFSGNTKFGDGGVDFLPIAHLYKTQVRELGAHLGLAKGVVTKPSSPQLWPGHLAEHEIPIAYEKLDLVLAGLFDEKLPPEEVARRTGVGIGIVKEVIRRYKASAHKRSYPPMLGTW